MERLRIIWLMEYFQIPQRRLGNTLGVSRSSVRRWLKVFERGSLGKRYEPKEPVSKTLPGIARDSSGRSSSRTPCGARSVSL